MMLQLLEHLEAQEDGISSWAYIQGEDKVLTDINTTLGGRRVHIGVELDVNRIAGK